MHLLATSSATLDEIDDAIDLEQTPAECVVLSFSDTDLTALAAAWNEHEKPFASLRLASLKKLRHPMSVDVYIERVISKAKVVVVRCLGGLDYWRYGLEQIAQVARENAALFAALPGDDRPDPRLEDLSTIESESLTTLDAYFREGGPENLASALAFMACEAGSDISAPPPEPVPAIFPWSPSASPRIQPVTARSTALIIFYRANVLAADTAPIESLMKAVEREGLSAHALAITSLKDPSIAAQLAQTIDTLKPSVILNTTAFSAMRDDETTILDTADVPVLQVVLSSATQDAWNDSDRGLGPTDLAMNVVLPEIDGRILTRAISFKSEHTFDTALEHASIKNAPIADRTRFVARLAANWVELGATPRGKRRVALVFSDYPCRGGRTGYAVGLDTPKSVVEILRLLNENGYDTGNSQFWTEASVQQLCQSKATQTISVPLATYESWFATAPESVRTAMTAAWGSAQEDPACQNGVFSFPCIKAGNITVLVQPDRGHTGDKKQSYHDTTLPPRHGYAALYTWMRHEQQAHACIHLGTHGTLEWLPGKALALSNDCFPEAVLGPTPVIYPFIVNNPGEAVQAKRRIAALTLGHLTPPLSDADLAGPLGELEGLIEEYAQADGFDKRRIELLEREIIDEAWRSGLAEDCGVTSGDGPREAIAKLDAQLCDIKELAIRDGLHVFGSPPTDEQAAALAQSTSKSASEEHMVSPDAVAQRLHESADNEQQALVAALDARRIPPGPSGAPSRGRLDVLPTGRNLTSIDPRTIPTRTAAKIGVRAADEVIRRHLQDTGEFPRELVMDLWASASLRTGGDDLAQALWYLGARPTWDFASSRVTGFEIIPLAKLARPRIGVTLRVSGLFRDIFPAQIALFLKAVSGVAALDEPASENQLAAPEAQEQNAARVFSNAPGQFGAGAADLALDGQWQHTSDLAESYIQASRFAIDVTGDSREAESDLITRIKAADALVHPQDDRERDILDGDGVADYMGGFAAAAKELGTGVALYHLDTSRPEAPKARALSEEVARVVRGRLTNPRWIEAMLGHTHRGVAEIAQGVDALFAFAATTQAVSGHLFDAVHLALVVNDDVLKRMWEDNPDATRALLERLNDAIERGLWVSRRNAVRDELHSALRREEVTHPATDKPRSPNEPVLQHAIGGRR